MKSYKDLVNEVLPHISELFPWDMKDEIAAGKELVIVDIREPYEFDALHIQNSINIPRGILESACDYGYEETVPKIAAARNKDLVLVCRSGNRSALAAYTLQQMGYQRVRSLKTGLKGWSDFELPLTDNNNQAVDIERADEYFTAQIKPEQLKP